MNIFGQKLRKLREDKGLTQQQLAECFTNSYLSDAEKGAFIPSEEKLKKTAKALHTPYSKLKELLIESKLESMGITEHAFIGIFKDYPRLTCRVPKLFRQEASPQLMVKLTDKKIKWATVEQVINKGESTELVAAIYGVSRRRIQQLVKYYRKTGEYPMLDKALDLEYFETPNDAFIRKMRCGNTLGMFFEWSEREVSL